MAVQRRPDAEPVCDRSRSRFGRSYAQVVRSLWVERVPTLFPFRQPWPRTLLKRGFRRSPKRSFRPRRWVRRASSASTRCGQPFWRLSPSVQSSADRYRRPSVDGGPEAAAKILATSLALRQLRPTSSSACAGGGGRPCGASARHHSSYSVECANTFWASRAESLEVSASWTKA